MTRKPNWTSEQVYLTVALAREWLETNVRNRKLSTDKVRRYAKDMVEGLWQENGENFIFSGTGILLDGQHRLEAAILSNHEMWITVTRGVDPNAFHTIDSGEARRPKDVLSINGEEYSDVLAPAINHHERYSSQRKRGGGSLSKPAALRYLEENPQLRDSAVYVSGVTGVSPLSPSMSVALHAIFSTLDPKAADAFINKLITGCEIGSGDPVHLCRDELLSLRMQRGSADPRDQMNYALRAWNAIRMGDRPRKLRRLSQKSEDAYIKAA